MSTHFWYRLKKAYEIFPGGRQPVSGDFLAAYYQRKSDARGPLRTGLDMIVGMGFRAWVPFRAWQVQRKFDLSDQWRRRATKTALNAFCDPHDIALFGANDPSAMGRYVRRFEATAVNRTMNPRHWQPGCLLNDKIDFYLRCADVGLPHPVMRAYWRNGQPTVIAPPAGTRLVLKPAGGQGGAGVKIVDVPDAARTSEAAFMDWLLALGRMRGDWLVQDLALNHQDVRPLAMRALSTARVSTLLNEAGQPEIVTSVLRFPSDPETLIDNVKSGALMAAIDAETGQLGMARRGRGVGGLESRITTHPHTGAEVAGRQLPHWKEVIAFVKQAHLDGFSEYTLIGWDVAFTPNGPVLLEGNGKPSMIIAQRANGLGVGETRFGELLSYHLDKMAQR